MIEFLKFGDGHTTSDPKEMEGIARLFFGNLFSSNFSCYDLSHVLTGIDKYISNDAKFSLVKPYIEEEILDALKSMRPLKALGIDSFLALFF